MQLGEGLELESNVAQCGSGAIVQVRIYTTRKLCYRKDDRVMRAI